MGAENSVLEGCEWDEPLESSLPWTIYPVVKADGATATVFQAKIAEKKDGDLLKKNTAILRGLRHPNIIRYIGGGEARDDIWLATEYVTPLITSMPDLTFDEICVGLHDLLQAVNFLHSTLGTCHNNLCISSLFLGHDGTWKLGELQHACKFSDATQAFLDQCRAFRKEDSLAPEEKAAVVQMSPFTGHARDMYSFGVVLDTLLESLREKDDRMKDLEQQATACFSSDPSMRPTAASLLKLQFLRSDLFEIIDFLKNVTMKSEADKKDFFSTIVLRLEKLPQAVIARRLVIPLLARFVLLDESADRCVIPHLLTPKSGTSRHGLLSEDLFRQYVIPQLYNIFHVHDCHIRLVLLQHFSQYVHLFSRQQLDDDIFLQILLGVRDSDDRVVAASLRALADLVPIMGGDVVVGAARKPFFFHGLPKQVSAQDLAKISAAPQNVTAILSSHKPLLKDLAAG
ncbi:protein-associating with the carboxyl-terminal domain of ezrin-like, partial [Elysia marginata]